MTFWDFLQNWWAMVGSFILGISGLVAWGIRVEMKQTAQRRDFIKLEERLAAQRSEDREDRHRAWEELKTEMRDIRSLIEDVLKKLPQR